MNYFELYPGDYLRDTSRLSLLEHGAYLRLLMAYYAEEEPLPADHTDLYTIACATSASDKAAVRKVADRYFPVGGDGLRRNARADEEIAKAGNRIEAAGERKGNDAERKRRSRMRRAQLFADLQAVGIVPDAMCTMAELSELHEANVTGNVTRDFQVTGSDRARDSHAVTTGTTRHTPHATSQVILPASSGTDSSPGLDTHRAGARALSPDLPTPTQAAAACLAMREAGLASTNPAHPELLALLPHASPAQFAQAAATAAGKGKGFAYALGVLRGQLADAAAPPKPGKGNPEAIHTRNHALAAEWLADGSDGDPR